MTLYSDDNITLIFQDLKRTQAPIEYEMPYVLIYSETYTTQRADGRSATVERTIKLSLLVLSIFKINQLKNNIRSAYSNGAL